MLIPVIKGKEPKESALEKGWELDVFMPKLAKLSPQQQVVVIFVADPMNNPVYHLSKNDKVTIISDYFGFEKKVIEKIYDNCFKPEAKEYEAVCEYMGCLPDSVFNTYTALVEQNNNLSQQIKAQKVDVSNLGDATDKAFDRVMKFQEQSFKVGENIRKLEELLRSPEEKHLFENMIKRTKSILTT